MSESQVQTQSAVPAFVASALDIATRINGTTVGLGSEVYNYPTLETLGLPAPDSYTEEKNEAGFVRVVPVYTDEKLAFVQDCIIAKVESICRNAVKIDKTAAGGPSYSLSREFPTDWPTLLEGGTGAQYFVIRKNALGMFEHYLNTAGVAAEGVAKLVKAVSDDKLAMRSEAAKVNIGKYLSAFTDSLDDNQLGSISMYLGKVEGWLNSAPDEDDFDLG